MFRFFDEQITLPQRFYVWQEASNCTAWGEAVALGTDFRLRCAIHLKRLISTTVPEQLVALKHVLSLQAELTEHVASMAGKDALLARQPSEDPVDD